MSNKTARQYRDHRPLPGTRKKSHVPRTYRTRLDPFAAVWPAVEERLKAVPRLSLGLFAAEQWSKTMTQRGQGTGRSAHFVRIHGGVLLIERKQPPELASAGIDVKRYHHCC
jgi:hypothetical protein